MTTRPLKSGGTLKFKVQDRMQTCTKCACFLQRHFYVHQCIRLPHAYCYECLKKLKICKHCHVPFTRMYKCEPKEFNQRDTDRLFSMPRLSFYN